MKDEKFTAALSWSKRDELPKTSAVYGLHDGHGQLLYVGQSVNIWQRIRTHNRAKQVPTDGEIRWMEVTPSLLREVEKRVIDRLQPPWNGKLPAGSLTSVKVADAELDQLKALAAANCRSLSGQVSYLIRQAAQEVN